MRIIQILILISLFVITSCNHTEKSNELMQEAMNTYLDNTLPDQTKVNRSLELTNKALDYNPKNTYALRHKISLLFRQKKSKDLINTIDQLILLRPEKPYYMTQKATFLELFGDSITSRTLYNKAGIQYEELLKQDSLNFDLLLEYVQFLDTSGDSKASNQLLTKMKEMPFEDYQKEVLHHYKSQQQTKLQLAKFWAGEIKFNAITRN